VGGRLLKTDEAGQILYLSPAVRDLTDLRVGDIPRPEAVAELTGLLTQALEMAAGLRPVSPLLETLWTKEAGAVWPIPEDVDMISFSGGVAECVRIPLRPEKFGDIGPALGQAIRQSRLCQGAFMLGAETLRATVIGAGCHSTQLSGSTIFRHKLSLPLHDLPVVTFSREAQEDPALPDQIRRQLSVREGAAVLAFPGVSGYDAVASLAKSIAAAAPDPCLVCLEADMAKALGQRLALLRPDTPCLCIDRVQLSPESYLDIGSSTGPALPVVVKTLVFGP